MTSGPPTTEKLHGKKDQHDAAGSMRVADILIDLSPSILHLFLPFSLSLPHILLFSKFRTIDFGTLSHLPLNLGRGTSRMGSEQPGIL